MHHSTSHAIVIGASMGGLLAARALADHYQHVSLIERDAFPAAGQHRKGVPQSRHAHGLLASGRTALETLFPGLTDALAAHGASSGDIGQQVLWYNEGGYHQRGSTGMLGISMSRRLLEAEVRTRLLAHANVEALERCDVLGLETDPARTRVTGVRLIRRADSNAEEILRADLIVDASGRGSRSPAWLAALGYQPPVEEQVKISVGYATGIFRRSPAQPNDVNAIVMAATSEHKRGAVAILQEDHTWIVTLAGYLGDHPPTDEQGFLAFARSLPAPEIANLVRSAELIGPIVPARYPASTRRRYERLQRFPEGYLVFGDALCSFNPVYGQGMSVAATEALVLSKCLTHGTVQLAQRFFMAASTIQDAPWSMAVGSDLRFPEVEGQRSTMVRFINWYLIQLHRAARNDAQVSQAFLRVINLIAPPPSILHPSIVLRVLGGNLRSILRPRIRQAELRIDRQETIADRR